MKRVLFVLLSCACSTPPRAVEIAAPLSSAQPVVFDEVAIPEGAVRIDAPANGDWAASFPGEKNFATYDVRASRVLLTWTVGPSHLRKDLIGDSEDYPVNHVASVALEVRARGISKKIELGELSGEVNAHVLSWCSARGFRSATPQYDWKAPAPAVASMFDIGITQGDDQFMVVRDGATLHVLHAETSDGKCDDAKQGPLLVCDGFQWSRIADIHVGDKAVIYETVLQADKPFDCTTEHWGSSLIKPP
jgi:hypothetical protein